MTSQVSNTIGFQSNLYVVVDASNGYLFEPEALGFRPISLSTACYRGFICEYTIENDQLFLQNLEISTGVVDKKSRRPALDPLPELGHVKPNLDYSEVQDCAGRYENLRMPLAYSGSFLASRNKDNQYDYRMRGCARAWDYDTTILINTDSGKVASICDVSDKIRTFIQRYMNEDMVAWEQKQNARRFLDRHFGRGFSIYPGGA